MIFNMKKKWWKESTVYQIYPRSFYDSNGDGIGDINGIKSKLDYLQTLGIDVLWVSPMYASPNADNGYDISDYKSIMKEFGTMKDFDDLLTEVHNREMKLIMDLVINHTSDEHPWFIESQSSKESPYRDYYIWHPGKNNNKPNNWEAVFGGSVWKYDKHTQEYYLHVFSEKQPDLNWENPTMRKDIYKMINWWLDKGIDGFRIDAITHIKKRPGLPDMPNPNNKKFVPSFDGHLNQPGIQPLLEELKNSTFDNYDIMTVGEANGVGIDEADEWVGEFNGKFNMIFQFEHLDLWGKGNSGNLDIQSLKKTFTKWQKGLEDIGWNALFLENHDQPRSVSTWGNDSKYHKQSAKCLATLYFLMQGTPFIYQGQEIGMTNTQFQSIDDYDDVAIKNMYYEEIEKGTPQQDIMNTIWKSGRDNSRTPMQWENTQNGGFTDGTPWLKINPNYTDINVEQQVNDSDSIYNYYKKLIQLRKQHEVLIYGHYNLILKNHDSIYAYTRTLNNEKFIIITNLFSKKVYFALPADLQRKPMRLYLANYKVNSEENEQGFYLKPYEARVYKLV